MSIFSKIAGFFRREAGSDGAPGAPRTGAVPFFGIGGVQAMSLATVCRCVKLLSESVANLPVQYLRRSGDIFTDAGDARLDYLLNVQPDTSINAFDFWRQVVQEVLLDGNAYIVPVYNQASLALDRLALCSRGTVSHDTLNDRYMVCDSANGISGTYDEDEIIHIKGMTMRDCKRGVSVLTYARLTMDIAAAGDRETLSRFTNGGNVRGLVSNDRSGAYGFNEYADKQLEGAAKTLDERFREGERIVGLPGDVDFKQITLSSADMQFLESRKFTVIELCRFFSVPPSFVYADTSSNYKSVGQADIDFLSHTLNPLLRNIETELRRKLVAPGLCHKYRFRFDRRELFACDLNGMVNYGTKMLQIGATVNEVRRMNNLRPVEGGDTALVSANLRAIADVTMPETDGKINLKKDSDE